MSQFRDTFTRGKGKESVLSYDDFASRIFTSGLVFCFLVPITVYLFKKWFFGKRSKLPPKLRLSEAHVETKKQICVKCECSLCKKRREEDEKKAFKLSDNLKPSRVLQAVVLAFFWWLLVYLIAGINPDENIKRFDPFELLGLSTDATKKDIQKAYRHLSLKYHPDRNPNDPEMSAHFVLITKAYRTLTNEISRMNYAKYGNPDGPGMMKIGIGLPRFLVDENNQLVILTLFFLILLIVVPALFIWYYRTQKNLTATGVRLETLQLIYYSLNENTRNKALPEVYACCSELKSIPFHSSEETELRRYFDVLKDYKRKNVSSEMFRNFLLLLCHLNRVDDLTQQLQKSQKEILKYSMVITQCMLDVALSKGWMLTFRSALDMRRSILQAVEGRSESFYQIPHFTEYEINHVTKGKASCKHVEDYVRVDFEAKKGLNSLSKEKQKDIEEYCKYYPNVSLDVKVYVEGEDDVYQGDLVTVEVTLTRKNLKEGELIGPIHAPQFPFTKYEQYFFLVTFPPIQPEGNVTTHSHTNNSANPSLTNDASNTQKNGDLQQGGESTETKEEIRCKDWENNVYLCFSTSTSREAVLVEKHQVLAEKCGLNTICVTALNDSYFGADFSVLKRFYVHPRNTEKVSDTFKIHPEDLKLDEEVNPIAKMIGDLLTIESSEEEEIEYLE